MERNIGTLQNDGTLVAEQSVDINGGNNAINGDIHQTFNSYGEISPSFSELDFDLEEANPSPVFTDEVINLLLQKRILIIKGNNHFDLLSFGRLLAKVLKAHFSSVKAFELIQNEENETLIPQLNKEKNERVLVLNGIHPRHIDHDFEGLIKICEEKKSFYIIGIESDKSTWEKAGEIINDFWYKIPDSNHYNVDELVEWFIRKLSEESTNLLADEEEEITKQTLLSETVSLKQVVEEINSPQKLTIFLNLCRTCNGRYSDKKLFSVLTNLNEPQEKIVIKWFNALNADQKIIALTAALFNGLFCHQYFEILTQMIQTSFWKQSENMLGALDYHKMDFLDAFFRFEPTEEGDLLVARNPTTRVNLLKTAIHQYPRHIEKALEIFSINMQKSYDSTSKNWNLFGTVQKRALIRQAFIESTRDIGINALFNIERIYLELAASNHKFIQGIAAKSLAQYRFFEKDELLFETVNNWLHNKSIEQRMELFLDKRNTSKVKTITSIKATTIRVLAYAADYDRPNQLHHGIIDYLVAFAKDPSYDVQEAVAQVIPKFIHHHSSQLQNQIFDVLMPNETYRKAISNGLMMAYSNYPETLKNVINHWLSICTKDNSKENRRGKATKRDNALMTIVETLSKIELGSKGFTFKEVYGIAAELLKIEKRGTVVSAILELIARLQSEDYDLAYRSFSSTIELLSRKRQKEMVRLWFANFLKERAGLPRGEFTINLYNTEFPVWNIMSNRPLTKMEEALFRWLNSKSKAAQRFATLTFLEIAKSFEIHEFEKIKVYRKQQEERKIREFKNKLVHQSLIKSQQKSLGSGLGFVLRIKIFFYLLFEDKATKQSLKDVIQIFLSESYSKEDLKFVIYKWDSKEKGEFSTKLAKWLNRFKSNF